jgi:predicted amidohydrolase YtcJ
VNAVKFFSDGGLSGKTAALKRHYKNSNEHGVLRLKKADYKNLCMQNMENGLGIATHAIGDAAIEFVIGIYKELHKVFPGRIKRIEHLGLPGEKHLQDMSAYGISTSMQTIFIDELGKNFTKYLDDEYLRQCYPVHSVLKHNILMALSSDAPVVKNFNPLKGAAAAVSRKTAEGNVIAPAESISISEALKAYTVNAAEISHLSNYGSLQTGMLADLILLDKNPLEVPVEELQNIKVEKTFVNGECVWERR